jgi:hypothetical protein
MVYSLHSNEAVANLVKRAGGTIDYLVADEPFTFGHESASGNSCRYPIQQVAQSFAYQVASVRAVFPGLQVVDDEASSRLTDLAADAAWVDALTAAFGPAQPFVISLDVQWQKPVWLTWARPFVSMLKSRGIGYGVIYHSINKYKTDLAWLQRAAAFAATWERTVSLRPTYVVLQSWSPAPSHLLPETDPTALTSFILTYCNQITRFRSSCNGLH